jgi:hypothetical protein
MAGRLRGTPKTGGRKAGTRNRRTIALQTATAAAAEQIKTALGPDAFDGDAHALLASIYRDPRQPIGLRLDAAKAAIAYERPRLAAIETKVVDDLDGLTTEELKKIADGLVVELTASSPAVPALGRIGAERSPPGRPKLVTAHADRHRPFSG